ncbi:sulfatase-like hydrolase/transferase [Pseudomonas arcuscaelestis]|uniref:sulfatase-like hydrolase/transferase n=1 Tax=Pseudomonas arcuscaelestis TaxID=2710591 RepID=UPI00193E9D78|nr:sulfatase-like hydrolase/transferase [Pseudomonas arcuscaelestis]MBM3111549.1 sulfatase-like hydrolase/transferase [Pseudomonas arcuscaelestis]
MIARNNANSLSKTALLALCAASGLFLWVPLYIFYLSINDINFTISDFLISSLIATLVAAVVFFVIARLFSLLRLNWLGSGVLYFILFWSCIAGFILPVVEQAGMVSPDKLTTNMFNLSLVAIGSLLLTLLTYTRLKSAVQVFVLILAITTLASAIPVLFSKKEVSFNRFTGLSSTDNVLVLSFDGLAGVVAKQVLEENPDLKAALKDFTFYDNAVSLAPATTASLRAEVYGNINFRLLSNQPRELDSKLKDQVNSIQREQSNGADVVTYGAYSAFNNVSRDEIAPGTLREKTFGERASSILEFYPYIAARIGTAHAASFVRNELLQLKKQYLHDTTSERLVAHQGPSWDALNSLHSDDLVMFTDKLHIAGNKRSVRYLHLLHTHFPVDLDENCNYRSADKAWFDGNQNYQGLINETHCALKQTATVIEKLKALGIYDKTLLVVKSDHGAPASYLGTSPEDYMINDHPMWGYNRYRPLLMIKTPGQVNETLIYNSKLASLSDLAKTLCIHAPGEQHCEKYKGLDLLNPDAKDPDPLLHVNIVKNRNSSFDFDTHLTVDVPRLPDFAKALENTGKAVFTAPDYHYQQRKDDLLQIKNALEEYHKVNGKYPVSKGFDGLNSQWGKDSEEWISGLAPKYIPALPRDPALSTKSMPQYMYRSDGSDYKLLAHGNTLTCKLVARLSPELLDPLRNCWGFGYWTDGARAW